MTDTASWSHGQEREANHGYKAHTQRARIRGKSGNKLTQLKILQSFKILKRLKDIKKY